MKKAFALFLVLASLMAGCSAPPEETQSPDTNKTSQPQATSNNTSQVAVIKPAETPAPAANPASALPKIFLPVMKIDFGTQRKDKSLVRTIAVKNVGKADLKIESVVPS
jgi:PBP1b-binding outer membrane lipoprotein LpoB